ncbi:MAG: zf-HC2 domain-containing protein, partial [Chloroflexota bacterium]|nr:zf-HC2 domain-containing protein [Chloroflexota bacterium]
MISHERAEELISARMDAPLNPAEHYELQSHLAACPTCRVFVSQADDIARGLYGMTRLHASPAVSRAVMSAVREEQTGWAWLSQALQAFSSPGMAAAASMALIVALAGVLYVAINDSGRAPVPTISQGTGPVETISAVADAPLPTAIPTQVVETPKPEDPKSRELASA